MDWSRHSSVDCLSWQGGWWLEQVDVPFLLSLAWEMHTHATITTQSAHDTTTESRSGEIENGNVTMLKQQQLKIEII